MRISDWSSDVCSSDLHRAVAAAPDVVLAGPHQLYRRPPADRLGHAGRLRHHVGIRRRTPAEAAAGKERVNAHLLRLQIQDGRGGTLVHRWNLRAGPDVAAVVAELPHAAERLPGRMGEIEGRMGVEGKRGE